MLVSAFLSSSSPRFIAPERANPEPIRSTTSDPKGSSTAYGSPMTASPGSPAKPVLVTGASGNVGAPLVEQLTAGHHQVIAASPQQQEITAGVRRLDFEDPTSFASALDGIGSVFLMRPPQISDTKRFIRPFITAMAEAHVEHVVFLSLMGVNRAMPHWQVEQDLKSSGLAWTMLRPSFFSQNLGGAYRADIRDHDRIRLASGRGRTSFIDTRDIAEVAARILTEPSEHRGQAYTLSGPAAVDYHQVASMLSAALGRPITYEPIGLLRYRRELTAQQLPSAFVNVQLLINVIARVGLAAKVDPTLPHLLKRPARTLHDYIHDHTDLWRRAET